MTTKTDEEIAGAIIRKYVPIHQQVFGDTTKDKNWLLNIIKEVREEERERLNDFANSYVVSDKQKGDVFVDIFEFLSDFEALTTLK